MELSEEGKEEIALALILWRDFKEKEGGKVAKQMFQLAKHLDVQKELMQLLATVPRMKIEPRDG